VSGGGPVCGAWPIPIRIKLFIVLCDLMSFQLHKNELLRKIFEE
jgi:hypothetical protein